MGKRPARRLILVTAVGAATAFICYFALTLPPAEPCYHGHPLSYWLRRLNVENLPESEKEETQLALNDIGTNHLSMLLAWFREKEPPYKEPAYEKALDRLSARSRFIRRHMPPMPEHYHPSHPNMAYRLFTGVPTVAREAIPQFINFLSDKDDEVKGKACMVLGKIGKDAIPALTPVLSDINATNRALAAFALGEIGSDAKPLIPKLESMLMDKTPYVPLNAAEALRKIGGNPDTFVPALLQCLHQDDMGIKSCAMDGLSKLKEGGRKFVPELLELLASCTNQDERGMIFNALHEIDPEAAAKVKASVFPEPGR